MQDLINDFISKMKITDKKNKDEQKVRRAERNKLREEKGLD